MSQVVRRALIEAHPHTQWVTSCTSAECTDLVSQLIQETEF